MRSGALTVYRKGRGNAVANYAPFDLAHHPQASDQQGVRTVCKSKFAALRRPCRRLMLTVEKRPNGAVPVPQGSVPRRWCRVPQPSAGCTSPRQCLYQIPRLSVGLPPSAAPLKARISLAPSACRVLLFSRQDRAFVATNAPQGGPAVLPPVLLRNGKMRGMPADYADPPRRLQGGDGPPF